MRRFITLILICVLIISAASCGLGQNSESISNVATQKNITKISQSDAIIPSDYSFIDYKERAENFDTYVYQTETASLDNDYLPLIWKDETYDTFGIAAYVGDERNGADGSQEAVTTIASVLSASLIGLDKSSQDDVNYVNMLHAYYSEEEKIIVNNPAGSSAGTSMWYLLYPSILFCQVSCLYPEEDLIRQDALETIESWYKAYQIMQQTGTFNYTGFDFDTMMPYQNDIWNEPDCAAGIAVLMHLGYKMTGTEEYMVAVNDCLIYLNSYEGNPLYEVLLYFAPGLAAEMNARYDMDFDVEDLLQDIFSGSSIPRGGWGSIAGNWGDYSMNGLMGSSTDGGGYAFAMNSFSAGYALSSLAKYDSRYANSIGIWYLNLVSNAKYFFADTTDEGHQSAADNSLAMEILNESSFSIPYEGIRKSYNSKTPWFGGDPTVYGWAETDLSLYSGAHIGMLAAVAEETDVDGILKINCNATEYLSDSYPTYLIYNPYSEERIVTYNVTEGYTCLFDSVSKQVIAYDVTDAVKLTVPAETAMVLVEVSTEDNTMHQGTQYLADGRWIASDSVTLKINGKENNDTVSGKVDLDIVCISSDENAKIEELQLIIEDTIYLFTEGEKVSFITEDFASGSKTLEISVTMTNGKTDKMNIRLNFE